MRLDDFNVVILPNHSSGECEELEAEIDTYTHVGGEYDSTGRGGFGDTRFSAIVESGGADHELLSVLLTDIEVVEGCSGRSEIDDHIEVIGNLRKVVTD